MDISYIKPIYGDVCGPHATRLLYYRNIHPNKAIRITIDHWWVHENQVLHQPPQQYVLGPVPHADPQVVHPSDKFMGCPIPGPTMQQFHWDVIKAELA